MPVCLLFSVLFDSCSVISTTTKAIDCLERLFPEMTYYVFSGTLNRDLRKPNFGSVSVLITRTETKRSNPKFWFPWCFSKPNLSHTIVNI